MFEKEIKLRNKDIQELKKVSFNEPLTEIKSPKTSLVFETSLVGEIELFTVGIDGTYYVVERGTGVLKQYKNIDGTPELMNTGVSLNDFARLVRIIQVKDGFVLFTNDTVEDQACIWKMDDMDSQPILVYKTNSPSADSSYFALRNQFGIKEYFNGLDTIFLVGVYGRGNIPQDLLLSTDSGDSFEVVKQTTTSSDSNNSHWHDVAIDVYHGLLWASQGDGTDKRNIYWSSDFGENWNILPEENGLHSQPTMIVPFHDRVLFGRDSGIAGYDIVRKPDSLVDLDKMRLEEFKVIRNVGAHLYYPQGVVHDGNEAYNTFVFDNQEPRMLYGTGDGGKSIHGVYLGFGLESTGSGITSLVGIDDEHVYAYRQKYGGALELLYSKRVEWIG